MLDLSCPDWVDRLKTGRTPIPSLPLNEEEADRAVAIFNRLRLPDVPGQPRMVDAAGQWVRDIVRPVFGAVQIERTAEGLERIASRTISKFFVLVPKKNGKTTNGAAIMLTALLMNRRPRAEFLLVGPTQKTADLAYSQAAGMIAADETGYLSKRFHVRDNLKSIEDRTTGAKLVVKTFDNKVLTGVKPVGILVDELHELGKIHYADKVMAQLRGGIIANPEGFLIYITTQSDDQPAGEFKAELEYARGIRDGEITGADLLPILFEFPMDMQAQDKSGGAAWRDPQNWSMVLPALDRPLQIETLRRGMKEAEDKGGPSLAIWASQHLNVQIGIGLNRDPWAGARYWLDAADPDTITVDSLIERCDVITVGVDGGGLDDMLGLALCGRDKVTSDWLFWHRAWVHPDALDARKENIARYHDFAAAGDLVICDDAVQDIRELAEIVARVNNAGLLPEKHAIGLDPVGVAAIIDELDRLGIANEQMAPVGQGYRLSGTIKGFERKLKDGTLWHDGSKMMAWCVGNAKAELKGSALLITKEVAGKAKIDPLIAAFNAFALMARNPVSVAGNTVQSFWEAAA